MITALLDTDTVIELLRGNAAIHRKARSRPARTLGISTVTFYELQVGVEKSRDAAGNRKLLEDALAPFAIVPFDDPASLEAAKVRAHLEMKGRGIGPYDTLIAGHALALGVILITSNMREFSRVRGLKLENWMAR